MFKVYQIIGNDESLLFECDDREKTIIKINKEIKKQTKTLEYVTMRSMENNIVLFEYGFWNKFIKMEELPDEDDVLL